MRVLHLADAAQPGAGDDAAGLPDEQGAGRDVPGRQLLLPESVETPGCHVGQIDGGRSGPPDAAGRPLWICGQASGLPTSPTGPRCSRNVM